MRQERNFKLCPGETELALFIEGKLSGARLAVIKQHLNFCSLCSEMVKIALIANAAEDINCKDLNEKLTMNKIPNNGIYLKHQKPGRIDHRFAAKTGKNFCVLYAEMYILDQFGIRVEFEELVSLAGQNNWLTDHGVQFKNIGKLLEHYNIEVERKLHGSLPDILDALTNNHYIIVGVDVGELFPGSKFKVLEEKLEDWFDRRPDHALIVTGLNYNTPVGGEISLLKFENNQSVIRPVRQFLDAWDDSGYFMVIAKKKINSYE
jgi:hypothetical protein